MNKQIKELYKEFKEDNEVHQVEIIETSLDYDDVVIDVVDSVLSCAKDLSGDIELSEITRETLENSQHLIYTQTLSDIYRLSPFSEDDLDFDLSNYKTIDDAIKTFSYLSLELSVRNNDYIQELERILEIEGVSGVGK